MSMRPSNHASPGDTIMNTNFRPFLKIEAIAQYAPVILLILDH